MMSAVERRDHDPMNGDVASWTTAAGSVLAACESWLRASVIATIAPIHGMMTEPLLMIMSFRPTKGSKAEPTEQLPQKFETHCSPKLIDRPELRDLLAVGNHEVGSEPCGLH